MLSVRDLSFDYHKHPVLNGVAFSLDCGELGFLVGPNGSGKTTLMRCLLHQLLPRSGTIEVDGKPLSAWSPAELARRVAYVPQASAPTFNFPVLEVVLMGRQALYSPLHKPGEIDRIRSLEALQQLGIEALADRGIAEISGGERQLVLIARALVQEAKLLLLDEPTANLDYGNQYRVLEQVRQLANQGYAILLTTHNPQHALDYGDHLFALAQGRLVAEGPPAQTLTPDLLHQLYQLHCQIEHVQGHPLILTTAIHSQESR